MPATDAQQLRLLFRRTASLPCLTESIQDLIDAIDRGESSVVLLERIIKRDPAFHAEIIRYANSGSDSKSDEPLDIGAYISRIGFRSMRMIATSILLKNLVTSSESISDQHRMRLAESSVTTGYMAKYLLLRWRTVNKEQELDFTPEEVFAAGVLSQLSIGILGQVAPEAYQRCIFLGPKKNLGLDAVVDEIYGVPLTTMAAETYQVWHLPESLVGVIQNLPTPWVQPKNFVPSACVSYGAALTRHIGCGFETWETKDIVAPEIKMEVGISNREIDMIRRPIMRTARKLIA